LLSKTVAREIGQNAKKKTRHMPKEEDELVKWAEKGEPFFRFQCKKTPRISAAIHLLDKDFGPKKILQFES